MKDFESLLFNINITGDATPRPGTLLVAEPFLTESYFHHAVICMVDHDAEGSMGVVLNRVTEHKLGAVVSFISDEVDIPIYCGGPMSSDRLYFLHTYGALVPGGREVVPGLWLGGDFEAMAELVNGGENVDGKARFFIGYSGWSPGQLEGEITQHTWALGDIPTPPSSLFDGDGDHYWHRAVRALGPKYRGWLYHPQYILYN